MYIHSRTLALAAGLAVGTASGAWLVARDAGSAVPRGPDGRVLSVAARPAEQVDSYTVARSYVGRVESARATDLAFELRGLVLEVVPEEGDAIEAGQVVARLDTARLRARRAELAAARDQVRATLALARSTHARFEKAAQTGAVSRQEWDETRRRVETESASLARVEAQIGSVDVDLAKSILRAPFGGRVSRRHVDEGAVVEPGTPVLHLLETGRPEVRVGVAHAAAFGLAPGQEYPVVLGGRRHVATLRSVLPERAGGTRTVGVILTLPSAADDVRDGDLAELELAQKVPEAGFWLPTRSLTEGARGLWSAFAAEPLPAAERTDGASHRLARRQLEVIHQEPGRVFVRGTLRDGEPVVADGVQRLVPQQRVRLVPEDA